MEKDKITAEWARNTANTLLGEKIKKQIDTCLEAIEKAVARNEFSISVTITLDELVKQELTKRGFKVTYNEGDFRDQREGSYHTITWK